MILTVIIPVYNRPVTKILNSIGRRSDVEYIVVDDCSTHDIECPNWPEIRLFRNERNSGPGWSRNVGLDNARGDYILFLDSDDRVADGFLELCLAEMQAAQFDLMVITFAVDAGNGVKNKPLRQVNGDYFLHTLAGRLFYTSPVDKIYSRRFLDAHQIRFPNLRSYEDVIFIRLLAKYAEVIRFQPRLVYIAEMTTDSVSRNKKSHAQNLEAVLGISASWSVSMHLTTTEQQALRDADARLIVYEILRYAIANSSMKAIFAEHRKLLQIAHTLDYSPRRFSLKYRVMHMLTRSLWLTYLASRILLLVKRT